MQASYYNVNVIFFPLSVSIFPVGFENHNMFEKRKITVL